jgi:hypothetical protein
MKKISFNYKYGLTESVLTGQKTMFRVPIRVDDDIEINMYGEPVIGFNNADDGIPDCHGNVINPNYNIGEVVAIAQSYEDADTSWIRLMMNKDVRYNNVQHKAVQELNDPIHPCPGTANKRYVKAGLMPYQIKITDIKLEKLQDISNEDCLKEGIYQLNASNNNNIAYAYKSSSNKNKIGLYNTPREAFRSLASNKLYRKNTWDDNPYVFVYTFEVIKDKIVWNEFMGKFIKIN